MEMLNKVELVGIVGSSKSSDFNNHSVVRFSLCSDYCFKNSIGEFVVESTWHSITWFPRENVDSTFVERGAKVHVIGRLRNTKYMDNEGQERSFIEVLASDVNEVS